MKKMTRYIGVALLCLYSTIMVWAQPNITQAEYFVDADPGIGHAMPLIISPGTNLQNQILNIDPAFYTPGVHRIGLRAQDANGAWSFTNYMAFARAFAPLPQEPSINTITNIEYFIDADPGIGNATPLPLTPSTNINNISFNIDPTLYSSGVHRLGMRAKDAGGSWSLTSYMLFAKAFAPLPQEPAITIITNVEYFIDVDPGIGKGVPLAFQPGTDLASYTANVNITGLAAGSHKIVFRGKSATGAWSLSNVYAFTVTAAIAAPAIEINSVSKTLFCSKDSFAIGYQKTGNYATGNIFTAYLSDASGSFANETAIGSLTDTGSGLILCNLPPHLSEGAGYKLRVKSSNAMVTGNVSIATLTIHDRPLAQTIAGLTRVNGTFTQPYAVPATAGSNWNWQITGGAQSSGGNTNSVNITWAQPATPSMNGKINVIETSQFGCVGDTSTLSPTIYKLRISDTVAISACKGFALNIGMNADGAYYAVNTFTAQLSDASGSFATPVNIGSVTLAGNGVGQAGSISAAIPFATPNGTNYKVRVVSSNPAFTGDTSAAISIIKPDIGADINRMYCMSRGYNLTPNFTDNTLTYTYFNNSFAPITRPDSVEAGTYQVVGTNAQGCKDTASVTLTGNPLPNLGTDTTLYHNCPGETSNLNPLYNTSGLSAVWNAANPSSVAPGDYRLVVTNSFGCTDTASAFVKLEVAVWTGIVSSDWHNPANWNIAKVPTDKTHVIISGSTANPCIISTANAQAASVQLRNGATVQAINNKLINIKGTCTNLPVN